MNEFPFSVTAKTTDVVASYTGSNILTVGLLWFLLTLVKC